jgi:hypothetical protein
MRSIAVKFVPRLLGNDQKKHCIAGCSELKEQIESDPSFISTIITGDDSWIYGYDQDKAAIISLEDTKFTGVKKAQA